MGDPLPSNVPRPLRSILVLLGIMLGAAAMLALVVGAGIFLHGQFGKRARHERRLIHQPAKNFSQTLPAEVK